jgi:hypothetical protein
MRLPNSLTKVTKLSKIIALVLFVALPFIGFALGMKYQQLLDVKNEYQIIKSEPTINQSPSPSKSSALELNTFVKRRYITTDMLLGNHLYPKEMLNIPDKQLVGLNCSPQFFSWDGKNHSYYDEKNEKEIIAGEEEAKYLAILEKKHGLGSVMQYSICKSENNETFLSFSTGPCGGGCAGIPQIAELTTEDEINKEYAVIKEPMFTYEENREYFCGAYCGCEISQLTTNKVLYYKCTGEGTASIGKIDLGKGTISPVKRCVYTNYGSEGKADKGRCDIE